MTDDELNAAVAREVMGWLPGGATYRNGVKEEWFKPDPWSPATDITSAFEVVERMRERGFGVMLMGASIWRVVFTADDIAQSGRSESLPRAICEAAVAAVRSECDR